MISLGMISAAVGTDKVGVEGRRSSTRTPILFTIFPPGHGTGLEQLSSSDKHSQHHKMLLHPRLLIAAAMVIRLSPTTSRPRPAAWLRAGTYREEAQAGWRAILRHVEDEFSGST